jgi:uncharacterized spore protein YtfJ
MSEEHALPPEEPGMIEPPETIGVIQDTMDKFMDSASVYAVYSEPIRNGDTLVIPAAEVLSVMGFGMGSGSGPSPEGEERGQGEGSGGGGGGRVLSRPVAVIIASPEGVRVEPVVDVTKVALAALTAAGFMVGMLLRMNRPRKSMPNFLEE